MSENQKKLYLSDTNKKLAGVCGGMSEYFDVDVTVIRLGWVIATIFSGIFPGLIAYLVAAILIPKQPD